MSDWEVFENGCVLRKSDGLIIAQDAELYQDYLAWVAEGNVADPVNAVSPADELIAYAREKRWAKEQGGLMFFGVPVLTDDRSQRLVANAFEAAKDDPNFSTVWDAADGTSVPLDAATCIALGRAMLSHVNGCFVTFAQVKASIQDGTITTQAQVDEAFA